jgi:hypothetical protein
LDGHTDPVDIAQAADQLYALAPDEFIDARNELVRAARAAGEKELAGAIAGLRKPTAVAWLTNRLARECPDQVGDFLALGPLLRDASASLSGPALRDLSRQRQALVQALVRTARQVVAGAHGPRISEDVARGLEATLHAALADPAAAASVQAGRLSGGLAHTGFGAAPVPGVTVASSATTATTAAKKRSAAERRASERAEIEAELARAWAAARDAADSRDMAAAAAAAATSAYDDAQTRLAALQAQLRTLQDRLGETGLECDQSRAQRDRAIAASQAAERGAERARRAVTDLAERLEKLSG